jgi:hypothetical protein
MKHRNNHFFFWCYHPVENHTEKVCESFVRTLLTHERKLGVLDIDYERTQINNMFEGSITIWGRHLPGSQEPIELNIVQLQLNISSVGLNDPDPEWEPSRAPQFERQGCITLEMKTQDKPKNPADPWVTVDEDGRTKWDRMMIGYIRIFEIYCKHFEPVFGFGHIDYNRWWDDSFEIPPPETRVWPFNMYDLGSYPDGLRYNLDAFASVHPDEWTLYYIEDRFAILRMNELRRGAEEVGSEVTRAVLGEDEDALIPKVGYPPPHRWWE